MERHEIIKELKSQGKSKGYIRKFTKLPIGIQHACIVEAKIRTNIFETAPSPQSAAFVAMLLVRNIFLDHPEIVGDEIIHLAFTEMVQSYDDPSYGENSEWEKL
jgi:hypothetical protein